VNIKLNTFFEAGGCVILWNKSDTNFDENKLHICQFLIESIFEIGPKTNK